MEHDTPNLASRTVPDSGDGDGEGDGRSTPVMDTVENPIMLSLARSTTVMPHENAFRSFSPIVVEQFLAHHADYALLTEPCADPFHGVLLFVDMSGFTPLSERLSSQGPQGIEALSAHLNHYFGSMVDIIHRYEGDIAKFAGDALMVVFAIDPSSNRSNRKLTTASYQNLYTENEYDTEVDADERRRGDSSYYHSPRNVNANFDPSSLRDLTLRACSCALSIHSSFDNFSPAAGVTLRLHSAISAGLMFSVHVGGYDNRWEWLIKGRPLAQLGEAMKSSEKGQIVLHSSAFQHVSDAIQSKKINECYQLIGDTPTITPNAKKPHLTIRVPQNGTCEPIIAATAVEDDTDELATTLMPALSIVSTSEHEHEHVQDDQPSARRPHSQRSLSATSITVNGPLQPPTYTRMSSHLSPSNAAPLRDSALSLHDFFRRRSALVAQSLSPAIDGEGFNGIAFQRLLGQTSAASQNGNPRAIISDDEDLKCELALRAYVPSAVLARVAAGHRAWLAEFRRVTTLFILLPEQDWESNDPSVRSHSLQCLQTIVHSLMAICFKHKGDIRQLITDDKGTVLIFLFGLQADWANPLRGVRAALDVSEKMKSLGHKVAIGLTTGKVFCGTVGNYLRCEYAAVGDKVNTAARLMVSVPGGDGIYVDQDTVVATGASSAISFHALRPIHVKGKSAPIAIFSPARRSQSSTSKKSLQHIDVRWGSKMVGRKHHRELVDRFLTTSVTDDRYCNALFIEASQRGVGKSVLLSTAYAKCLEAKHIVLMGVASDGESTPYSVFESMVPKLLKLLFDLEVGECALAEGENDGTTGVKRVDKSGREVGLEDDEDEDLSHAEWLHDPEVLAIDEELRRSGELCLLNDLCSIVNFQHSDGITISLAPPPSVSIMSPADPSHSHSFNPSYQGSILRSYSQAATPVNGTSANLSYLLADRFNPLSSTNASRLSSNMPSSGEQSHGESSANPSQTVSPNYSSLLALPVPSQTQSHSHAKLPVLPGTAAALATTKASRHMSEIWPANARGGSTGKMFNRSISTLPNPITTAQHNSTNNSARITGTVVTSASHLSPPNPQSGASTPALSPQTLSPSPPQCRPRLGSSESSHAAQHSHAHTSMSLTIPPASSDISLPIINSPMSAWPNPSATYLPPPRTPQMTPPIYSPSPQPNSPTLAIPPAVRSTTAGSVLHASRVLTRQSSLSPSPLHRASTTHPHHLNPFSQPVVAVNTASKVSQASGADRAAAIAALFGKLLAAVRALLPTRRLVILVDDANELDSASEHLLLALARSLPWMLFVFASLKTEEPCGLKRSLVPFKTRAERLAEKAAREAAAADAAKEKHAQIPKHQHGKTTRRQGHGRSAHGSSNNILASHTHGDATATASTRTVANDTHAPLSKAKRSQTIKPVRFNAAQHAKKKSEVTFSDIAETKHSQSQPQEQTAGSHSHTSQARSTIALSTSPGASVSPGHSPLLSPLEPSAAAASLATSSTSLARALSPLPSRSPLKTSIMATRRQHFTTLPAPSVSTTISNSALIEADTGNVRVMELGLTLTGEVAGDEADMAATTIPNSHPHLTFHTSIGGSGSGSSGSSNESSMVIPPPLTARSVTAGGGSRRPSRAFGFSGARLRSASAADEGDLSKQDADKLPAVFIQLGGLNEEEMDELLQSVLKCHAVEPRVVKLVLERSNGVPLFAEELAAQLINARVIQIVPDTQPQSGHTSAGASSRHSSHAANVPVPITNLPVVAQRPMLSIGSRMNSIELEFATAHAPHLPRSSSHANSLTHSTSASDVTSSVGNVGSHSHPTITLPAAASLTASFSAHNALAPFSPTSHPHSHLSSAMEPSSPSPLHRRSRPSSRAAHSHHAHDRSESSSAAASSLIRLRSRAHSPQRPIRLLCTFTQSLDAGHHLDLSSIPVSMDEMIAAQIDALPVELQLLLKICAVFGRIVDARCIRQVWVLYGTRRQRNKRRKSLAHGITQTQHSVNAARLNDSTELAPVSIASAVRARKSSSDLNGEFEKDLESLVERKWLKHINNAESNPNPSHVGNSSAAPISPSGAFTDAGEYFAFKHAVAVSVAYHRLPFSMRGILHKCIAEWYQHVYELSISQFYSRLAWHWQQAALYIGDANSVHTQPTSATATASGTPLTAQSQSPVSATTPKHSSEAGSTSNSSETILTSVASEPALSAMSIEASATASLPRLSLSTAVSSSTVWFCRRQAIQFLRLAGEEAARQGARREAISWLKKCMEFIQSLPEADELQWKIQLLVAMTTYCSCYSVFVGLGQALNEWSTLCSLCDEVQARTEQADEQHADSFEDSQLVARATFYALRGYQLSLHNASTDAVDPSAARLTAERLMRIAEKSSDWLMTANALVALSFVQTNVAEYHTSFSTAQRARNLMAEHDLFPPYIVNTASPLDPACAAISVQAVIHCVTGELATALSLADESIALAERNGEPVTWLHCITVHSFLSLQLEIREFNFERYQQFLERLGEMPSNTSNFLEIVMAVHDVRSYAMMEGVLDHEAVQTAADRAWRRYQSGHRFYVGNTGALCELLHLAGYWELGLELVEQWKHLTLEGAIGHFYPECLIYEAHFLLAQAEAIISEEEEMLGSSDPYGSTGVGPVSEFDTILEDGEDINASFGSHADTPHPPLVRPFSDPLPFGNESTAGTALSPSSVWAAEHGVDLSESSDTESRTSSESSRSITPPLGTDPWSLREQARMRLEEAAQLARIQGAHFLELKALLQLLPLLRFLYGAQPSQFAYHRASSYSLASPTPALHSRHLLGHAPQPSFESFDLTAAAHGPSPGFHSPLAFAESTEHTCAHSPLDSHAMTRNNHAFGLLSPTQSSASTSSSFPFASMSLPFPARIEQIESRIHELIDVAMRDSHGFPIVSMAKEAIGYEYINTSSASAGNDADSERLPPRAQSETDAEARTLELALEVELSASDATEPVGADTPVLVAGLERAQTG